MAFNVNKLTEKTQEALARQSRRSDDVGHAGSLVITPANGSALGWEPRTALDAGLAETARSFRQRD